MRAAPLLPLRARCVQVYPAALSNPRPCPPPALALLAAHRRNETTASAEGKRQGLGCPAAGRYHMAQAGGGTVRGGKGALLVRGVMCAAPPHSLQPLLACAQARTQAHTHMCTCTCR
ncbi:hypothetical protein EON67_06505 [archaeon]|nr:MAG: hypothetical protein EON67_06505 [archaeon]